jgi:hypothetical protein
MRTLTLIAAAAFMMMLPAGMSKAQEMPVSIVAHDIQVFILPPNNSMTGSDNITLSGPAGPSFSFTLNKNFTIDLLTILDQDIPFTCTPYTGEGVGETGISETLQLVTADFPPDTTGFHINYHGVVNDPINPSNALTHIRGDFTSGIISEDGVYLSSETGWYPDTLNSMATFWINIWVPVDWKAVTQGNLIGEGPAGSGFTSTWGSPIPYDGVVLVANKYVVTSRDIGGVKCSTYFYEDNPELAASFLDKLEQYLPAYTELFGPFPYSRFDVVENFFSTGYGMPGFTLLGSRVLTMPYATAEGSLAHELVHNWWGNYVFVDWDKGNWCEGLTFFSTNYYWNILSGQDQKAADLRLRGMVSYSVQVHEDEDYPLRQFRTKFTDVDGDIGYNKSSAVFIMLHEMLGKEKFFEALKLVVERFGGKKTTWDDFQGVFEEVSGQDLGDFFSSWLDNKGGPNFDIGVGGGMRNGKYHVSLALVQDEPSFVFPLPVLINTDNGDVISTVDVRPGPTESEIEFDAPCHYVELDPEHYVFRRLERSEIPSCLNSTLEADKLLIVLPSGGENEMLEVQEFGTMGPTTREISVKELFQGLADEIVQSGTVATVKFDNEVTEEELSNSSILCLGSPSQNSLTGLGSAVILEEGFMIAGVDYQGEGNAVLVSNPNPYNENYDISFYFGNSPQSMFKAGYMFFYGWDSYVVFDNGNVIGRGTWDTGPGPFHIKYELQ